MSGQNPIIHESWDLALPAIPQHSHLHHLEPIGIGTSEVESLTGYLIRLAEVHNVTPSTLVRMEILPHTNRQYFMAQGMSSFWSVHSKSFNGMSPLGTDIVKALKKLTCRYDLDNLTFLKWQNVLASSNLTRSNRAWCPDCYQEWYDAGKIVYEPLLWALQVVTHCTRHNRSLLTHCPHCLQILPVTGPQMRPGYCSRTRCRKWLGEYSSQKAGNDPISSSQAELEWQNWVATQIGALFTASPHLSEPATTAQFQQSMAIYVQEMAGGKFNTMSRKLREYHIRIKSDTFKNWYNGYSARLSPLLHLCYCMQTSPLQILTGIPVTIPSQLRCLPFEHPHTPPTRKRRPYEPDQIRQLLASILDSDEEPPPSLNKVCQRLGYSYVMLSRSAPELCSAISQRFLAHRENKKVENRQRVRDEMRQAMLTIHAQGLYPNAPHIIPLLSKRAYYAAPEARIVWRETLRELGWER